jgi:hypothetical protein
MQFQCQTGYTRFSGGPSGKREAAAGGCSSSNSPLSDIGQRYRLFLTPILDLQSGDFSEILFVVRDQGQIQGQSGRRDQQIHVVDDGPDLLQGDFKIAERFHDGFVDIDDGKELLIHE